MIGHEAHTTHLRPVQERNYAIARQAVKGSDMRVRARDVELASQPVSSWRLGRADDDLTPGLVVIIIIKAVAWHIDNVIADDGSEGAFL